MLVYTKNLKFKEKIPKQCPQLYWELRKLGARPYQANWKSKAIYNFKEGQELSSGSIYNKMRKIGVDPIASLKLEILFWAHYDEENPITTWEAGLLLHIENRNRKINYVNSLLL
jgi:hypothetical protein